MAEEINRSVLNVRDISEQTCVANDETAASSIELARLGDELTSWLNASDCSAPAVHSRAIRFHELGL